MTKAISNHNQPPTPFFNAGTLVKNRNGWQWLTQVGPYKLSLDIIPIRPTPAGDEEIGIASFVVMEQEQSFLDYVGHELAKAIVDNLAGQAVILLTAETKGAHLVPWLWKNLFAMCDSQLEQRIITLRKGEKKPYMHRAVLVDDQEITSPQILYQSITSAHPQRLSISPKDLELLLHLTQEHAAIPVFADDFIGQGGTVVAVHQLFERLGQTPPHLVAVIGTDGVLYKRTFTREKIAVTLLPQPFPLMLPTFARATSTAPWIVAD